MEVMQSIKGSSALKQFLATSEQLSEEINDDLLDIIEEERSVVEEKVESNKYAYLVLKHSYYDRLDSGFQKLN